MQNVSDLYRLHVASFGVYILAEALLYFISVHATSTLAIQSDFFREIQPSYKIQQAKSLY